MRFWSNIAKKMTKLYVRMQSLNNETYDIWLLNSFFSYFFCLLRKSIIKKINAALSFILNILGINNIILYQRMKPYLKYILSISLCIPSPKLLFCRHLLSFIFPHILEETSEENLIHHKFLTLANDYIFPQWRFNHKQLSMVFANSPVAIYH